MPRFILMLALSLPVFLFAQAPVFGPALPPYFKLDRHCEEEVKRETNAVGAAIAVVEGGRITFKKAFGRLKKNDKALVNADTVFQLGSTSKSITALLVAKVLPLDTPILIPHSRYPTVLAHHVLSHSSGFKRIGWNWQIEHGASRDKLRSLFAKREQQAPGLFYDYHNVAFSLIEEPLAQVCGTTFEKALEEHLFRPLSMTRTTVGFAKFAAQDNRAWPHEKNQRGSYVEAQDYSFRYHETVASAAGINSSINDMAQLLQLILGQFSTFLSDEELAVLYAPRIAAPDAEKWFKGRIKGDFSCHYGLGFRILKYGDKVIVFHGGWLKGFASFLAFSPQEKKGIVVLSNAESGFALSTAIDFLLANFD